MVVGLTVLSALLLLSPTVATAQQQEEQAVTQKSSENEALICKKTTKTGSLVRQKRVCLTSKQWDDTQRQGQELGRSMQPSRTTDGQ
jgi:hypothetical protein